MKVCSHGFVFISLYILLYFYLCHCYFCCCSAWLDLSRNTFIDHLFLSRNWQLTNWKKSAHLALASQNVGQGIKMRFSHTYRGTPGHATHKWSIKSSFGLYLEGFIFVKAWVILLVCLHTNLCVCVFHLCRDLFIWFDLLWREVSFELHKEKKNWLYLFSKVNWMPDFKIYSSYEQL